MRQELQQPHPGPRPRAIHPWPLRLMHALNAIAIIVMIGSGWQIYDASPLFGFVFPGAITIGQWLGAAIAWHLAAMWLLVLNGLAYLIWGIFSGHFREKFFPITMKVVVEDLKLAFRFRLGHRQGIYNAVQRVLYLGVLVLGAVVVLSGLAIWKPVQLWFFCDLFGGYFTARYVHFFAMSGIAGFLAIHLILVALVPKVLPPMITGGRLKAE